jgi:hypothetical protein
MCPPDVEYVLPLRWAPSPSHDQDVDELAGYLRTIAEAADVTVVDGSDEPLRQQHATAFGPTVRVLAPTVGTGVNGKVAGVTTGVLAARHERVVIADDDVRYDAATLAAVVDALGDADLVRPQNVFGPLPWHARWDTGRTLLNRALGQDHPGTFGLRRSTFLAMGGYDGDAMFENLELSRTLRAAGGREVHRPDLFVRRLPPTTRQFLSQRVRQAYDDLAQPARLAAELAALPTALLLARRPLRLLAALAGVVLVAERGRRRAGGTAVFRADASLWALPWLAERSVCVWLAVAQRARGGVPYRGRRVRRAASSSRWLRAHPRPPLTDPTQEPAHDSARNPAGDGVGRMRDAVAG